MRIIDVLENLEYFKQNANIQLTTTENPLSKAPKFKTEDTVIHWEKMSNNEVFNHFRAFYGTNFKTIRTKFNDSWFFIDDMDIVKDEGEEERCLSQYLNSIPGSIWLITEKKYKNNMYVRCKKGWIVIYGGYLEGKSPGPVHKFINQFIDKKRIFDDKISPAHFIFKCGAHKISNPKELKI